MYFFWKEYMRKNKTKYIYLFTNNNYILINIIYKGLKIYVKKYKTNFIFNKNNF